MDYQPTEWKNDKLPAVNADNLNKIEQALAELSSKALTFVVDEETTEIVVEEEK